MGFINSFAHAKRSGPTEPGGESLWRRAFGQNKEDDKPAYSTPPIRGGSHSRSNIAQPEAFKRLLQAMRSMAPGGWSDDRWEQTKHYVGIQYICISRIGDQLSQSEFEVLIKDPAAPGGERKVTENDPPQGERLCKPYDLVKLLEKPNNDDSWGDLMHQWNLQQGLSGMALTWMVPNRLGTPIELYPIPTATAIPQPAINPDYPDGYYRIQPLYPYGPFSSYPTPATAVGAPIPAQWMIRMKMPHPLLRYDGYSPLTAMRLHLDEIEAMDRSRWYSMKRTISPSAVLNFDEMENMQPLPEAEIERIRAEFENTFQGPENAGQLFVATPGAKLEPWGLTPKEMEYYQSWEQLVSFAMAAFGITKPAAGMIEDSSYATLFATLKQLHLLTLQPICSRVGQKLTRHLAPFFGDNLIVKVKTPRIDDHDVKRADVETLMAGKAIKKNEMRAKFGMPKTTESWGEDIAGDPSQKEQQQQQLEMQQQAEQAGQQQAHDGKEADKDRQHQATEAGKQRSHDATADMVRQEPGEVSRSRPATGQRGSLGPRKTLQNYRKKSLRGATNGKPAARTVYEACLAALSNGNGRG